MNQQEVRMLSASEMESIKGGFWGFVFKLIVRWIGFGARVQAPGCTPEYRCFPPGGDIYLPPERG